MARLFETIPVDADYEKSETLSMSPIVGINNFHKKSGLIPPAPKIDSANFTNIETCPKRLNYRHEKSSENSIDSPEIPSLGLKC